MDIRKLQRAIVDGLEDVKGQNIVVFNTEHLSPLFERVIIASGTSNRQTKALASSVRETVKGRGMQVMRCEGEDNGEWIIVDCGAAVVHLMQPAIREYYHLEEIWGGKPVKLTAATTETKLVKASEDASEVSPKKTPAAKKTAAKTPAKKAVSKAPAAKKAPAKAPAKTAPKKGVSKTTGVKTKAPTGAVTKTMTVGVKKAAPAKKGASQAAPTRRPAAKAAPAKSAPAAKKAPAKTSKKS